MDKDDKMKTPDRPHISLRAKFDVVKFKHFLLFKALTFNYDIFIFFNNILIFSTFGRKRIFSCQESEQNVRDVLFFP